MTPKSIQDILPLVEMPSRYLGTEINRIKKDLTAVDLRVALAFPDLYEIGSSHFGIQILYHLLNQRSNIAAERVFAPALDMEAQLITNGIGLFSLESQHPVRNFDILGFSLLYELTYTNVLNMLQLSGIPFLSSERDLSYPLLVAGGPCTCNPEPTADIFDAMVVGDGEEVLVRMCEEWLMWRKFERRLKNDLLERWADIRGVYVPGRFAYDSERPIESPVPPSDHKGHNPIKRAVIADLDKAFFPEDPLIPFGKPVHDRLRLEVSRGCSRGCRFCQAGMIYRPVRERKPEKLVTLANSALGKTGYEDLSLLSLSTGDYGCINNLMQTLMQTCEKEHVAISLPSLRAGTLNSDLMQQIKKVRKTGFTIAPEAGSQRLRDVINKNITEQDIIQTVQNAFNMGWQVIKLYFMVGLPTETQDDLDAIVELVKKLRGLKGAKGKKKKINVSVATFIPKAHTPFQWAPQISRERAWEIITDLKDRLNFRDVHFKWQNPDVSLIEGLMARGDRRMLKLTMAAYRNGCRFDGWSDHFDFEKWLQAFEDADIDLARFIDRSLDPDMPLPWDHIDIGTTKKFLFREWQKSIAEDLTEDCRWKGCEECGICDFEALAPIVHSDSAAYDKNQNNSSGVQPVYYKLYGSFSKKDNARFLGHLEMVKVFHRAIKRAGIRTDFSKGFHPMPKVSFDNPLPLGMESNCESIVISVPTDVSPEDFKEKLNQELPEGLQITNVQFNRHSGKNRNVKTVAYQITIKDGFFDQNRLHSFINSQEWEFKKVNRKGQVKSLDLKKIVKHLQIEKPNKLIINLIEEPGKVVRPLTIFEQVFGFQNEQSKLARVLKLSTLDE